ncbi:hypothetical protein MCCARTNEY_206 [Bacillus phage vB_BanH_McCartney]|nr:hypothetical protein MCCARTNEY_206 [Bacillus phage vB_BanH_McCartney]
MLKKITDDGMGVYDEFPDIYNHRIKADIDLGLSTARIRVYCRRGDRFTPMFLDVEQAKRLIGSLQQFVDTYEEEE